MMKPKHKLSVSTFFLAWIWLVCLDCRICSGREFSIGILYKWRICHDGPNGS